MHDSKRAIELMKKINTKLGFLLCVVIGTYIGIICEYWERING
jgi:hypothetical protein